MSFRPHFNKRSIQIMAEPSAEDQPKGRSVHAKSSLRHQSIGDLQQLINQLISAISYIDVSSTNIAQITSELQVQIDWWVDELTLPEPTEWR